MRTKQKWVVIFGLLALVVVNVASAQDDDARRAYERARDRLDDERYREAVELFEAVTENYAESDYAARAMYWQAFALYRMGGQRDLRSAERLLEAHMERYEDHRLHDDAAELHARILGQLAERGDREAAEGVYKRADEDVEAETRMMALNALLQMDSDRAMPLLHKILQRRGDGDAELRAQAMFLLSQHFSPEAEDLMMDALRNDPDDEVRGQALFWLGQSAGDRVLDVVEEILQDESASELHGNAIHALSQSDDERAGRMLRELALDDSLDEEIRGNCIFWLGQRHHSFEFLRDLYGDLDDKDLKEQVLFAMSQGSSPEHARFLKERFYDEDEDVDIRNNALFWLAQTHEFGFDELEGLYDAVDDHEMKKQVVFALSQQGGREAVQALIKIAREEKDVELRKNAIFWIGQSGDDAALDFLEELIDQ